MGKNSKITFLNFSPFECGAVEEYLEKMAEKGWLLQSINGLFLKFKKIEPQKLKYSVDVLSKISEFDHKDSDLAMEYREYCEAAGWKYLCEKGKVQVFCSETSSNTISIHTDEKEKFKSVFKASLYSVISQIALVLLFILNLHTQLFVGNNTFALATNLGILSIVAMMSFIFMASIEITSFIYWAIRNEINLKKNKRMTYSSYKQIQVKSILKNVYASVLSITFLGLLIVNNNSFKGSGALILLVIVILIIVPMFIKRFLNKERYSRSANIAITISSAVVLCYMFIMIMGGVLFLGMSYLKDNKVSAEKVLLTLGDFGYAEKTNIETQAKFQEDPYIRFEESIIAKSIDYSTSSGNCYLAYTVFQSEYPWAIDFQEYRLIKRLRSYGINLRRVDTKLPSNVRVYSEDIERNYVLASNNKVLEIRKGFGDIEEEKFLEIIYNELFKNKD